MINEPELATKDITEYLKQHEQKELLRFITCGSVDDGKSTLIGRLLYDTKGIYEDQLAAVTSDSTRFGTTGDAPDLALLVDGLQSEREQGITIDVAYRYFSTDKRKFIIADTPGHEQYTRNMATGASTAQLAIILVDARKGILTQTRRHSFISSLLGIKHVVVAINKMDLVDFKQEVFENICAHYLRFSEALNLPNIHFIPISALTGDNVVQPSPLMPWYRGPSLLAFLETVDLSVEQNFTDLRFPVQYVNRPNPNFRGFSGTIASGIVSNGDEVMVLPARTTSTVRSIVTYDGEMESAFAGQAVTITLTDEIDVSRGDMLVHPANAPSVESQFDAHIVWMSDRPLLPGKQYDLKIGTKLVRGIVQEIKHRIDVNSLKLDPAQDLELNGIALCRIALTQAIPFDSYRTTPLTGSFILIDRLTDATVGAGMISKGIKHSQATQSTNVTWHEHRVTRQLRANQKGQKPCILWFTGLSGSGKSTIANALDARLFELGYHTYLLDGDNIRQGLNKDLGFGKSGRVQNIRRIGEVAKLFADAGLIVLTAFISPFRTDRELVRGLVEPGEFVEIFVNTPLEVCEQRDPKGLYARARVGEIANFTGIDSPYEPPVDPDLTLVNENTSIASLVEAVLELLRRRGLID